MRPLGWCFILALCLLVAIPTAAKKKKEVKTIPDGTPISEWFADTTEVDISRLGRQYIITDYGVRQDSTVIQTQAIQTVIDSCAREGGIVVVPKGTFLTGSLFFRPGTHLYLEEGARLKGIDAITHYDIIDTRLEGQTIKYFAALVNAIGCNGFTISGKGTIDGNGWRFYDEFWLRRKVNPKCTNLEALRPRLVYIANSDDVTVSGVRLVNSGFWTNHIYNCNRVRYINCYIWANTEEYPKGPSTDGIDLDVVSDALIHGCYVNVNDDGICLKGGKGTWVDTIPGNGACERIIVQRCSFGKAGGGITFGSEAWNCRNVILRDCQMNQTGNIFRFKMRPDTPQVYEYVLAENISGTIKNGVRADKWSQFYNLLPRDPMPRSRVSHVTVRNIKVKASNQFYYLVDSDKFDLEDFTFEHIEATDKNGAFDTSYIKGCVVKDVKISAAP